MDLQFKGLKSTIFLGIILLLILIANGEPTVPYIAVILLVLAGAAFVYTVYVRRKIKTEGIETNATVTYIETVESTDDDGDTTTEFYYHVSYRNQSGETVEGVLQFLTQWKKKLQVGDWVKIKYLPDRQGQPIMTEKL